MKKAAECKMIPFRHDCEQPYCTLKALHVTGDELKFLCLQHSWLLRAAEEK